MRSSWVLVGWRLLVAGLAAAFAAGGCSATPGSSSPTGSTTGPTVSATPSADTRPSASPSRFWAAERVSLTASGTSGSPRSIAHGDRGTIVVGGGYGPRPPGNVVAWRDDGARGWQAVTSPAFEVGSPNAVAAWRGGFAAVGAGTVDVADGSRGFSGSGPSSIVWTSPDGLSWSRHELGPSPTDPAFLWSDLYDVIAFGDRLIAVGYASEPSRTSECPAGLSLAWVPRMWTSTDGRAWTRVDDPDVRCGRVLALARGGPGLVAVGDRRGELVSNGQGTGRYGNFAQAWTSVDGLDWTPAPIAADVEWLWSVADGPAGLVAVADYREFVVSRDGRAWERVPLGDPAGAKLFAVMINQVIADANGYVAVGGIKVETGYRAAAWASVDGRTWTRILGADSEPATLQLPLYDAYLATEGFVAVGGGATTPSVWIVKRPT